MTYGIPYSVSETNLVIELRESGLVGLRLTDQFRAVYPDRAHKSILNKIDQLRRKKGDKMIRPEKELTVKEIDVQRSIYGKPLMLPKEMNKESIRLFKRNRETVIGGD